MSNASMAQSLITVGEQSDSTRSVFGYERGGQDPPSMLFRSVCVSVFPVPEGRAQTGYLHKKKRTQPWLMPTSGSACAFPYPQRLPSTVGTHYN
jgi:hypothetical protein